MGDVDIGRIVRIGHIAPIGTLHGIVEEALFQLAPEREDRTVYLDRILGCKFPDVVRFDEGAAVGVGLIEGFEASAKGSGITGIFDIYPECSRNVFGNMHHHQAVGCDKGYPQRIRPYEKVVAIVLSSHRRTRSHLCTAEILKREGSALFICSITFRRNRKPPFALRPRVGILREGNRGKDEGKKPE